nr:non-ribosomal peptide synthetase [Dyella acidiphila]
MRAQQPAAATPAIPAADRSQPLPLSWAQQRLWFLDQLDRAAGAAYHLPAALRLRGQLNRPALQASLERIVERHEVLRTSFVAIDGEPVQRIHAAQAFELPLLDLRTEPDAESHAQQLAVEEAHAPFDLARGPLLRGRLLQLADNEHILLLTQHHIVSDGWSIGVLVRDLSALYEAFVQGRPDPLPSLPIQYADYAVWQRQALAPDTLRAQAEYWKQQLSGAPELLALPTDRPRPAVQRYVGDQLSWTLSPALSASVRQLCQQHGVTLFMAGLAAWSVLLSRWCGQHEVVIGIPAANRKHAELEALIGFFVNTSALRIRLEDAPTVEALLARIQQQLIEAHAYQDVPFEQVVEALQPVRSLSHSPVFQVMLAINNTPGGVLELPGLSLQALEPATRTSHFDLTLYLQDDGKQIECRLTYASDLFDRGSIERMARQYERVLQGMTADPQQAVDRLPLLDAAERRQVVETFNDTAVPYPADGLIHQLFEQQVLADPHAPALLHNGESLSYGELNCRANRVAHALIAQGVGPDDRVAIGMERSTALIVSLLGVLKAGAAYVPLDPTYPAERLAYMLRDSAPSAVLTQASLQAHWASSGVPVLVLDRDGLSSQLAAHAEHNPVVTGLGSRNLACLMYTSGSTGTPKGVMLEHRSVLRLVINNRFAPIARQDVVAHAANIAFDAATWEVWSGLLHGARVLLIDQADLLEPGRLLQALVAGQTTVAFLTVSLFNQYADVLAPIMPQFRHLLIGGEAVDARTVRRVLAATPPQRLVNAYGPTETTTLATSHAIESVADTAVSIPIGRPIANTHIYILDRHGEPVPIGVSGEIYIGGPGVARGYWNRPELTAERFPRDPFVNDAQARMYKTGDLGRWLPDGTIEYLGRNDFQVKIRGFRIELGEIEAKLAQQAQVRDAVVIAREDVPGDKRLVAYLTMQDGQSLSAAALRDALAQELPGYMLPSAFVQLEQLPLTPNGKLDRKALPVPDQQAVATRAYEAPIGEVEQTIAEIWQALLGLERVGRNDHFFQLGGHSLLAVQMIARLRKALGVEVTLRDLFVHACLQDLAQAAAQAAGAELAEIRVADRSQALPLSWPQQRLWFIDQFDPAASASYHIPAALRLRGQLDRAALSAALSRIVARHEILRTVFASRDGQAIQVIREAQPFDLRVQDLRTHADIDAAISRLSAAEAGAPFDLSSGPLLRGTLLQRADDDHILLLTQHHIVSDGWSVHVLVREVSALYEAYCQGHPDPLPALPIQYADYAVWQHDEAQRALLRTQAAYWKTQLDGAPTLLSLPTDRPRPAVQSHAGAQLTWTLDTDAEQALRTLGQQHDTTLFMTALAAWSIVLSRWSGQGEVVIGTPVANRQRSELEPLLGFFVNTLALRIRLDDAPTVESLLARIRAQSIDAYAHQDLPFEQLVEVLQPPRSLSHSPVFQVSLAVNNTPDGVLDLPGLCVEVLEQDGAAAHFDITLSLHEAKGRLVGQLSYASDLFEQSSIERMARHFMQVLRGMVVGVHQPVDRLPLLDEQECRQLLAQQSTATPELSTPALPVHALFEQQVQRTPDAIALSDDQQSLTYAQLNAQANRLAHALIARGVTPNDRVALGVERSVAMVVGILGILKAGAGYVPLDPSYPAERLAYLLQDSAPALLLTQASLQAVWPGRVPVLQLDDPSVLTGQAAHNPLVDGFGVEQLAYVIYTSGSTGMPKGVMVAHRSLSNYVQHAVHDYLGEHIAGAVVSSPLSFDATVTTLLPPLLAGKPVLLLADGERSLPQLSARLFAAGPGWLFKITPAHLDALSYLPEAAAVDAGGAMGEAAHCIVVGGEQLSLATLRRWKHKLLPAATFVNEYGPTETTVGCSAWRLSDAAVLDALEGVAAPIGGPIGHARLYVLNEGLQWQPAGSVGELYIGGAGVTLGYLGRAALTAERFVRDPFAGDPAARMYRSGDLVRYRADGELEFLGRRDGQIKLRGFRIEPGEIEAALTGCDGVHEAAVIAREDVPGDKRLVAYVTSRDGQPLSMELLRDALARQLPEYMLPSAFVQLEQLPLTANGKLNRQALPAPDQQAAATREYEAPQGELEQAIAAVWQELLGVARVGRADHFFELGGHSLLAVQMIARLRQQGWPASVKMVFAAPGLAALASHINDHASSADSEAPVPPNLIAATSMAITPAMLPLVELSQEAIDRIVAGTPGGVANIQDIYPLSPLQEGMLFHHLLEAQGDAYLLQVVLAFEQRERLDAFLAAMQQVIERHDMLRSAVHWQGLARPVQVVQRHAALPVEELQLPGVKHPETELLEHTDPHHVRLDLSHAPLLRAFVTKNPHNGEWLLGLLHHHLIGDHVTLEIMLQEIQAILQHQVERLPRPVPYRNFIAQALRVPASVHEAYFREQLADVEEPTCLFDVANVHADGHALREERLSLDRALSLRVRETARLHGVSTAVLFHVAWARVLACCTGQDDVVFGTVLAGRYQASEAIERTLGLFINTLPLRVALAGRSVQHVMQETYRRLSTLLAHEQAPLALAQRCSGVASNRPLFNSLLNYRHSAAVPSDPSGLWQGMRTVHAQERTNYPVILSVDDLGEDFGLVAQCASEIDPARLTGYMETVVRGLVDALQAQDEQPMHALSALGAAERHQLLENLNATAAPYPADALIHRLFEQQAERSPQAIAVVFEDQSLTYAQLNAQANRLAHRLIEEGTRPGDCVVTLLERSAALVIAQLAILKAGATYVPIDPQAPATRQAWIIADCAARRILTDAAGTVPAGIDVPVIVIAAATDDSASSANPKLALSSEMAAYVMYTSGSTGQPKGVLVPHRGVNRLIINNGYASFEATDRIAWLGNPAFDISTLEVWAPLLHGARLVVVTYACVLQPSLFRALLEEQAVTVLHLTAGLFSQMADSLGDALARLRLLLVGGDAVDVATVARVLERYRPQHLLHCYGPTESTTFATTCEISELDPSAHRLPIGRPIANTRIYLLDAHGQPVPMGVAGELHVGGAGVALGYLNRPELTAERFLPDPFSAQTDARMYRTGDLARYLPYGKLEFLGRNDHQVKIRGYRIEPGEIEARLAEHPAIREAVVIAREDTPGDKRLVAYLVAHDETGAAETLAASLRAHLSAHLPEYMLPSAFVPLQQLPLTPNGKLDRRALPAPDQHAVIARAYAAPQGQLECVIAGIWQTLLGLERVGRHDHFFELGGHSLMIVSMIEGLRREGWTANVKMVFASPSLAALAAEMSANLAQGGEELPVPANLIPADSTVITPAMLPLVDLSQEAIDRIVAATPGGAANIQDIYPLSPLQEGMLFHHLLESEGDAYLLQTLLAFDRRDRLDAFLDAMQQVIDRHDVLRSAMHWQGLARPVQVVHRHASLPVEQLSLQGGEAELLAHTDPRRIRMDLAQAPLLRAVVTPDPRSGGWLLALLHHHMAIDHVALEIMVQEIQTILQQRPERLAAPAPYRNFIAQVLRVPPAVHEAYFREQLGDIEAPTCLFGVMNVHANGSGMREERLSLDQNLARRVRESARAQGVSTAVLFHVAWAQVLACCTGQEDVVFGTILAGRSQGGEAADRTLGLFINTLPLRVALAGRSVRQLVQETYRHLSALLTHEQAPLALAQRCSSVAADLPLFNALLNYRHMQAQLPAEAELWRGVRAMHSQERSNYPVNMSVNDLGEGFDLIAQCADPIDPLRLMGYLCTVMHGLVDALQIPEERPMHAISLLDAAERRRVIESFNATEAPYPADGLIHQVFEQHASTQPDAIALVHNGKSLSYAELNRRANQVAHVLIAQGVRHDDRVAIGMQRGIALIVGLLGILKAGGAYVPLDPAYPPERLAYMLRDSAPLVVLTQASLQAHWAPSGAPVLILDDDGSLREHATALSHNPTVGGLTSRHLAYIMYTSGSTGQPKGVMIEHRGVLRLVINNCLSYLAADDVVVHAAKIAFDGSTWEIWSALLNGAQLLLIDESTLLEPAAFAQTLLDGKATSLFLTTALFGRYTEALAPVLPQLRHLQFAGEAADVRAVRRVLASSPPQQLVNAYGPTEITAAATSFEIKAMPAEESAVPIGPPISNTRVYILDRHGEPVPIGVCGELHLGGPGVARGYWNRPDLTAERFLADPFVADPQARMYKSGDLGRWLSNGDIEYLGRNDFQVKIRGFRIELGEIEAKLLQQPNVRDALVIAREDVPGDKRLVAYLTSQDGQALSGASLRDALAKELAEYMLPAAFVQLERLPLTPNGKLERKALPAPDQYAVPMREYEAPQGELEQAIAIIWQELLGLAQVGRHDRFFELGGHSLLAMQMSTRLRERLGVELPLRTLFAHPTPADIAAAIAQPVAGMPQDITAIRRQGAKRPLFLVHPGGGEVGYAAALASWLDADVPLYGFAAQGLLEGEAPLQTAHDMARRYVQAMRRIQPEGPYRLIGYSSGGVIAYEMASQLVGADTEVEFVGLIDTLSDYRHTDPEQLLELDEMAALLWLIREAPDDVRQHAAQLAEEGDCEALVRYIQQSGSAPDMAQMEPALVRRTLAVIQGTCRAIYHYRPATLPVPVTIFHARAMQRTDPAIGWGQWVPPELLQVVAVDGNHTSLMEEPHIRGLGDAISAALAASERSGRPYAEMRYQPRIDIQSGKRGAIPLFCIPGAGASVAMFHELSQTLSQDIPVYGLQPRGLDGEMVPYADVGCTARAYIRAIKDAQPSGPYQLLGHSFGGWVGFEIALQLAASGDEVAGLYLLDSRAPREDWDGQVRRLRTLMKLVELYDMRLDTPLPLTEQQLRGLDTADQLAALHRALVHAGILHSRTPASVLHGVVRVMEANLATDYLPDTVYPGPVHLFSADDARHDKQQRADAWRVHAPALHHHPLPGNHVSILTGERVAVLGRWLGAHLIQPRRSVEDALAYTSDL